jgi:hypothetical protein
MQSTARPAISARLIRFTGGRSRGGHTGFEIIAETMPVPMGGVGVTKFAPEAPAPMGAMNLAAAPKRRQCFRRMGPAAFRSPPVSVGCRRLDIAKMGHSPGIEHPDAAAPGCSIVILHQRSQVAARRRRQTYTVSANSRELV